jgi:hypothetical protein
MAKTDPTDLTSLLRERRQHRSSPSTEETPSSEPQNLEEDKTNLEKVEQRRGLEMSTSSSSHRPGKKVGRPPGRRSNPDVNPLNLLIEEDLVNEVRYKLGKLNKGKSPKEKKSLSDLVETLLQEWLD